MGEGFLKALLHDIVGVFVSAGNAPRNKENFLLVSADQDFKCATVPAFGGSDERCVCRSRIMEGNIPQFWLVNVFYNLFYNFG